MRVLVLVCLLFVPTIASAHEVRLLLGQEATIQISGGPTGPMVTQMGAAGPLSEVDQANIRAFIMGAYDHAIGPVSAPAAAADLGVAKPLAPARDRVRIVFVPINGGQHSLLILENGYDQALDYRASIRSSGRESPTDVCQVMPRLRGYEHWPYPIEWIELSGFSLVYVADGHTPVCE